MKRLSLIIISISISLISCTQNPIHEKTDSVSSLVLKEFNSKNTTALYALTGDAFKKALSSESFSSICQNNLFPLGEIKEAPFEKETNGICAYKAVFNSMNLTMLIGLDKTGKIETLLFKPYVDATSRKKIKPASSNPLRSSLDKKVDSAAQSYITMAATTGLSIGILKKGEFIYYNYGETAKGNGQLPNEHTIFEIGSISKTFTAILFADAIEKGKVNLEDPASKYLPDSIPPLAYEGVPVVLKNLSNHTSGIPRMPNNFHPADPGDPYKDYDDRDLYSFYKNFTLTRKPGVQLEYSNLAAGTLGVILEKVNKKNYQDLIVETICDPLGMSDTREWIRKNDSSRFAKGYTEEGKYNTPWNFEAFAPAGSIRSTTADMLIYANANLGVAPKSLEKAIRLTHTVTFMDSTNTIGLGWFYIRPGRDRVLFHNGGTGGYRTYIAINLEKKFAVVVLSNTSIGVEDVGNAIMKWLEENHNTFL
jgi:CubicO group peptidase (beta-lactamase class C family)